MGINLNRRQELINFIGNRTLIVWEISDERSIDLDREPISRLFSFFLEIEWEILTNFFLL